MINSIERKNEYAIKYDTKIDKPMHLILRKQKQFLNFHMHEIKSSF